MDQEKTVFIFLTNGYYQEIEIHFICHEGHILKNILSLRHSMIEHKIHD